LQEEEDVQAHIEDCPDRTDVVVAELELAQAEVWNYFLFILLRVFDTQVVDLHVYSMTNLEELNYIVTTVANGSLYSTCGVPQGDHVVGYVSEIEVEPFAFEPALLLRYEGSDAVQGVQPGVLGGTRMEVGRWP